MCRSTMAMAVVLALGLASGVSYGVTFSIDQGPAGSVPPYNDGTLLVYSTQLGPTPDSVRSILVAMPLDALHIDLPVSGLLKGMYLGDREWANVTWTGALLYSLDHGDPFPIGILPDSSNEVFVAPPGQPGTLAKGWNLGLAGDLQNATEQNMGLGPDAAFDDDVDGLDSKRNPDFNTDLVFFSIDDRISLVPNLPTDMRTLDIFARFPNGGIGKVIDGVLDLGLVHQGDHPTLQRINDDIDAIILVNLDDCQANNLIRQITYSLPTGGSVTVAVDLGDGILFSLDRSTDLPYQNAGTNEFLRFQASLPTNYLYFSSYNGLVPDNIISNAMLGLGLDPYGRPEDIDALAVGTIPEPGTLLLLGTGALFVLGVAARRRMKNA